MSVLEQILTEKRKEVAERKLLVSEAELRTRLEKTPVARRGFASALSNSPHPAIIAEVKLASPSRGTIRNDLSPLEIARAYAPHAACMSVLTDEKFFKGSLDYLRDIRAQVRSVPLLRKDFIVDSYQVWEAKEAGADAVLLIVAALDDKDIAKLYAESLLANLDVLIEVHTADEMQRVIGLLRQLKRAGTKQLPLIGVNNRDLKSFEINLQTTVQLAKLLSSELQKLEIARSELTLVAESGLYSAADLLLMRKAGADAFLIGESLLKSGNPGTNLAELIKDSRQAAHGSA